MPASHRPRLVAQFPAPLKNAHPLPQGQAPARGRPLCRGGRRPKGARGTARQALHSAADRQPPQGAVPQGREELRAQPRTTGSKQRHSKWHPLGRRRK
ncbi:hypothetical protein SCOCK_460020 [Actinacidiphila cocklensis]|uniref:Uncharacterized protein n=1 Tax=Actinacidiphila cocklensis TaxID=887465 RepID=A0A9W4GT91_9ACTN|nr:hypothetical protein SCOCK_460020 [Actinacidiphila cocklensis]